eukprot:m.184670 g.184670  ORF g.184670 m.184670 type:complete len:67 (+) comp16674_c0_seq1:393-593(+)
MYNCHATITRDKKQQKQENAQPENECTRAKQMEKKCAENKPNKEKKDQKPHDDHDVSKKLHLFSHL